MIPERAVLLVRISDDREGEEKGVVRQEKDGRKHASVLGWKIGEVVVENDTSAFKRRKITLPDGTRALRTVRPGFRRVLELITTGGADGFIAYDLDRACRDPRDLEDLIDAVEERDTPVTSVAGSLRLSNDADVTMARVMVAVANKSSRDTSRRVKRKHEELAEEGKPSGGGRRAYGYDADGMTVREDEAAEIRWMAQRILAGDTLYAVADGLNARGVKPSYAERFAGRTISTILRGARIAGQRTFRGEIVGPAAWPAIVDRETWDRLQEKLGAPGTGSSPSLVRWLSGILRCSRCGEPLPGWSSGDYPTYWCAKPRGGCGRIVVKATRAEDEVERQLLDYLGRPESLAVMRGTYSSDAVDAARVELAEDEQQLKELAAMWARKEMSFAEYSEARKIIAARVEASRALVGSSLPGVVRQLLAEDDVAAGWADLDPGARRDVARAIGYGWWVMPTPDGVRAWRPDRIRPIREGEQPPAQAQA
jgi:DNA invertase Pin-like site-specific DNA recombinase